MKISKLFHWLYASLMLLPLSVFGVTGLYYGLNQNAQLSANDISTSIINAWNSTWQNPLFSWSSESFLIEPFNYITDLFSIPQNNTFSMALSYWLAISIVYLVFDVVMYVPLLAHRWLDKGLVE